MIDPFNFTNFNRSKFELEEVIIFGILVANKNAKTVSRLLDKFLKDYKHFGDSPFTIFSKMSLDDLVENLKKYGFGCYNRKALGIYQLVNSNIDLKTCSIEDLEKFVGIGKKTSRLFVLHSREGVNCVPIDVHILKYLKSLGYDVPKATPSSSKKYKEIEDICIDLANRAGQSCADWDLSIWKKYAVA